MGTSFFHALVETTKKSKIPACRELSTVQLTSWRLRAVGVERGADAVGTAGQSEERSKKRARLLSTPVNPSCTLQDSST